MRGGGNRCGLNESASLQEVVRRFMALNSTGERFVPGMEGVIEAEHFHRYLLARGMDDYGYMGCRSQKLGMDEFAQSKGLQVLSLPTGQGLMIKPSNSSERRC